MMSVPIHAKLEKNFGTAPRNNSCAAQVYNTGDIDGPALESGGGKVNSSSVAVHGMNIRNASTISTTYTTSIILRVNFLNFACSSWSYASSPELMLFPVINLLTCPIDVRK